MKGGRRNSAWFQEVDWMVDWMLDWGVEWLRLGVWRDGRKD
jgi:hypothetical protein